jgi:hypothetical protein
MAPNRENRRRWDLNRSYNDERFRSLERRCVPQFELLCRRNKFAATLSECELRPKPDPYSPRVGPYYTIPTQNFCRHSQMKYASVVISVELMELIMGSLPPNMCYRYIVCQRIAFLFEFVPKKVPGGFNENICVVSLYLHSVNCLIGAGIAQSV